MKHLDITLRDLFLHHKPRFFELLAGSPAREWLNVSLPRAQERIADFVAVLENEEILHIEFQSTNDVEMPYRMLEYYTLLYRQHGRPIRQILIYVGKAQLRMDPGLALPRLRFRYDVIDMRSIDPEPLLASEQTADHILAILCRSGRSPRELLKRILTKVAHLEGKARRDAISQLIVLSGLRGLAGLVRKESEHMSVVIDPMQNEVLREWYFEALAQGETKGRTEGETRGRTEGRVDALREQLEARFGPLPKWASRRLGAAPEDQLREWGIKLLKAPSLEAVLGPQRRPR